MLIIGLTGGIATGKSTIAAMLRDHDVPIYDADAAVHRLLGVDGAAVADVARIFGDKILNKQGSVDRSALGALVFDDQAKRKQLETILHPLVASDRDEFIKAKQMEKEPFIVLDVPLLFETGNDALCDYVIVAYAKKDVQYERAIQRPTMTPDKLNGILQSQMPIEDKVKKADFVLNTETSIHETRDALRSWMAIELKALLENHSRGDEWHA